VGGRLHHLGGGAGPVGVRRVHVQVRPGPAARGQRPAHPSPGGPAGGSSAATGGGSSAGAGASPPLSALAPWSRSRMPLTNRLDWAVLYRLASSSASLMATFFGTSGQ